MCSAHRYTLSWRAGQTLDRVVLEIQDLASVERVSMWLLLKKQERLDIEGRDA